MVGNLGNEEKQKMTKMNVNKYDKSVNIAAIIVMVWVIGTVLCMFGYSWAHPALTSMQVLQALIIPVVAAAVLQGLFFLLMVKAGMYKITAMEHNKAERAEYKVEAKEEKIESKDSD